MGLPEPDADLTARMRDDIRTTVSMAVVIAILSILTSSAPGAFE